MQTQLDYFLERFVHHLLQNNSKPAWELARTALAAGKSPQWLLSEVLWPAAECTQQLRHDRLIEAGVFNSANEMLLILASQIAGRWEAEGGVKELSAMRKLFLVSAPGEPSDVGATLLAALARAHGYCVQCAGTGARVEEIQFALSQLRPDVVVIQGSLPSSLEGTNEWVRRMKYGKLWPEMQLAVVGAMTVQGAWGVDLAARDPVELLEMLALFPEFRAGADVETSVPLQMSFDMTEQAEAVSHLMFQYFPPRRLVR